MFLKYRLSIFFTTPLKFVFTQYFHKEKKFWKTEKPCKFFRVAGTILDFLVFFMPSCSNFTIFEEYPFSEITLKQKNYMVYQRAGVQILLSFYCIK
jgi:hypothetical protein